MFSPASPANPSGTVLLLLPDSHSCPCYHTLSGISTNIGEALLAWTTGQWLDSGSCPSTRNNSVKRGWHCFFWQHCELCWLTHPLKNNLLTMRAAWPQGNLPFSKLAEKSCFLICPTEWKWRKTVRSLGVEVALLFLWPNSCGCWQNKSPK